MKRDSYPEGLRAVVRSLLTYIKDEFVAHTPEGINGTHLWNNEFWPGSDDLQEILLQYLAKFDLMVVPVESRVGARVPPPNQISVDEFYPGLHVRSNAFDSGPGVIVAGPFTFGYDDAATHEAKVRWDRNVEEWIDTHFLVPYVHSRKGV